MHTGTASEGAAHATLSNHSAGVRPCVQRERRARIRGPMQDTILLSYRPFLLRCCSFLQEDHLARALSVARYYIDA